MCDSQESNPNRLSVLGSIVFICLFGPPVYAEFVGGIGEPNDPYQVATAEQLTSIGWHPDLLDKHYVLINDIDLDPNLPGGQVFDRAVIAPSADPSTRFPEGTPFTGTFDGNGFVIRNLTISGTDHLGLFGMIYPGIKVPGQRGDTMRRIRREYEWVAARVYNLGLVDVEVTGTGDHVGALVGENYAGLIGHCYSTGRVTGGQYVGGLVGQNRGTVRDCTSTGAVAGYEDVGGLAGLNNHTVSHSHSTSEVTGHENVGGLVGLNWGIISSVRKCYSTGMASGNQCIGGLVGQNRQGGVGNCYSTSMASGSQQVGGLLGLNKRSYGNVINCYSTGSASGDAYVGGLVGENTEGLIERCYSAGMVSGQDYVGGLLGYNTTGIQVRTIGMVNNCFWDRQTSTLEESDGGQGLSTPDMQAIQIFLGAGWDFLGETQNGVHEIWQMSDEPGYPVLSIFNGYEPPTLPGQGTKQDPYLISTVYELGALAQDNPDAHHGYDGVTTHSDTDTHYRLMADIDLSGISWSRAVIPELYGHFDGNGFIIQNLTISGKNYLGLFGIIAQGGEVKNLGVVDVQVLGTEDHIGALVGRSDGTLTHCFSSGTVSGNNAVGGLVGATADGGEFAARPRGGGPITDCYSTCTVSGIESVGGLVGYTGNVVVNCYSAGSVAGDRSVGGLVGTNYDNIMESFSNSSVSGGSQVGGLVGQNTQTPGNGAISNCYSTGPVSGYSEIGGLIGSPGGKITYCYSAALVSGQRGVGGLVGRDTYAYGQTNCFWDKEVSGLRMGDGLTTAEMQTASTFLEAGWDFIDETENGTEDIWWIDEGQDYPRLWWELDG